MLNDLSSISVDGGVSGVQLALRSETIPSQCLCIAFDL